MTGYSVSPVAAFQRYYKNFPDFARDAVRKLIPGAPDPTPIQMEMADYLQNGPSRRMVLGFRGVAKSYFGGFYIAWRYLHDPEERVKYLSGDEDKVTQFSRYVKGMFDVEDWPALHHLQARKGQRDDQFLWDVGPASLQQYNSFMGSPVNSAIQGGRCTIGMLDDCEQKSNSISELTRGRILRNMMDVANMLIPESRQDMIVFGTYQSLSSVYITLQRERGYDAFIIPCRVPRDPEIYRGKLAPSIAAKAKIKEFVGKPTEPGRFPDEDLKTREKEAGPLGWQLEWMLSDYHADRFDHPFPLDRLIVWDGINPHGAPTRITQGTGEQQRITDIPFVGLPGDGLYRPGFVDDKIMLPYQTIFMAIDPSGAASADETAFVIIGAVPGQLHLLDWGGRPNGSDPKTLRQLALAAKAWKVREVFYENNLSSWGTLFEQALRDVGHPVRMEGGRSTANKAARIAGTLEPVIYSGCLIVSRKAMEDEYRTGIRSGDSRWQERLLQHQLAMFRRSAKDGGLVYDDRLDALELGVAKLHERFLRTGSGEAAAAARDELDRKVNGKWFEDTWDEGPEKEDLWVQTRR